MTEAWPGTLPQRFLIAGNQQAVGDGRLVSQTDTGPGKMRPRSSAVPDVFSGSMRMTGAQWADLMTFGKTTLGGWSLPFTMPATDEGDDWLVRFRKDGLPSRTNIGGDRWTVSMTIEILP